MEIFLRWYDDLDDLAVSVAMSWEKIRRLLLQLFALMLASGVILAAATLFPTAVLAGCGAVLLSSALVALAHAAEAMEERLN